IGVRTVAVVALLAGLDEGVSTPGVLAAVRAGVRVGSIGVVTLFGRLHHAIAAVCGSTVVPASVVVDLVAVVAGLHAFLHIAVATTGRLAVDEARAIVVGRARIALLGALFEAIPTPGVL